VALGVSNVFEDFDIKNREKNKKTTGFCKKTSGGWAAVYPEKDSLVLQIENRIWNITDDNVMILYFHNYRKKSTTFRIEHPNGDFEIIYDAWWKDRKGFIPEPMAASCEPENIEEDFFGYIDWLSQPDIARRLFRLWNK